MRLDCKPKNSNCLKNKSYIYFILFFVVLSYFLWLNSTAVFPDPDSFYHAAIVELMSNSGVIKDFDWLPLTTLNEVYVDHHFLYHLILVPLVLFLNPLVAMKLSGVIFASLAIIFFYWFLRRHKIRYSLIYPLILICSHQFIFRMNLAKIPSLSLIFLLIFLYCLFRREDKWSWRIFMICFFYVWLYGGWVIMAGIGLIYWFISGIYTWYNKKEGNILAVRYYILDIARVLFSRLNIKLLLNIMSGFIFGLVINPYFPKNLLFYWQQTIKIGLINYREIISVGGEWYGFNIVDLIGTDVFVFILLVVSIGFFFLNLKKQNVKNWTLFFVVIIFFFLTVKSKRNIEYFVPLSLIFSAFTIDSILDKNKMIRCKNWIKDFVDKKKFLAVLLAILTILQIPIIVGFNYVGLKRALGQGYNFNQFYGVAQWLADNTIQGDIVFHDDWSYWSVLFYRNKSNRYIIGLDPTFMYLQDHNKYWLWHDITLGKVSGDVCKKIKDEFGAAYVLVRKENKIMVDNIEKDKACVKVYSDNEVDVYAINV